ncbi:MAG: phage holin family protein [Woeseiaceae bacterium]
MRGFVLRTLITMLGLFLASTLVPGVSLSGGWTFILAAVFLGLVNGFIRPIAYVLTFPITLLTLGLFVLVLNAAMFGLVAAVLDQFVVTGFWAAVFGALIVSITSTIASWYIGPNGNVEVIVVTRR